MIPKVDGVIPTGKYEDPDLYFPLFTALQVNIIFLFLCSTIFQMNCQIIAFCVARFK